MLNLIPENWYWSKSLKRDVKFIEIYTRFQGENYGKAYVEFMGRGFLHAFSRTICTTGSGFNAYTTLLRVDWAYAKGFAW